MYRGGAQPVRPGGTWLGRLPRRGLAWPAYAAGTCALVAAAFALWIRGGTPAPNSASTPVPTPAEQSSASAWADEYYKNGEDIEYCTNGTGSGHEPTMEDGWVSAVPGCFPYLVSIRPRNFAGHICSGFLISDQLVATAAHCLEELHENPIVIIEPHGKSQEFRSQDIKAHPEFRSERFHEGYDFGLLKLAGRARVATPVLYDPATDTYPNYVLHVFQMDGRDGDLRMAYFKVVNRDLCSNEGVWNDRWICIHSNQAAKVLPGLSGGPVVVLGPGATVATRRPDMDLVVGIVSFHNADISTNTLAMVSMAKSDARNWMMSVKEKLEYRQEIRDAVGRKFTRQKFMTIGVAWWASFTALFVITYRIARNLAPRLWPLLATAIMSSLTTAFCLMGLLGYNELLSEGFYNMWL